MTKLNEITTAGIFFDASSDKCRKEVKAFMKTLASKQVKVKAFGYFDTRKPEDNFISDKTVYFATLQDFSFFFLPKTGEVFDFLNNPFDVLFVYSNNDTLAASSVVKFSKASLKVGFAGVYDKSLDLTFEIPEQEPDKLTEQIERYLQ